jgi:hypothetical protein
MKKKATQEPSARQERQMNTFFKMKNTGKESRERGRKMKKRQIRKKRFKKIEEADREHDKIDVETYRLIP